MLNQYYYGCVRVVEFDPKAQPMAHPKAQPISTGAALSGAALPSGPDLTPLDFLLAVVRDEAMPLETRIEAAVAALPYCHTQRIEYAPSDDFGTTDHASVTVERVH